MTHLSLPSMFSITIMKKIVTSNSHEFRGVISAILVLLTTFIFLETYSIFLNIKLRKY